MHEAEDKRLFARFAAGDKEAFGRLVARYRNPLYNYLVRVLRDRALAEDAFQETFLRVYQNAGNFDASKSFKTWLFAIATNVARDELKKRRREKSISLEHYVAYGGSGNPLTLKGAIGDASSAPHEHVGMAEQAAILKECLYALPDAYREVLLLFHYEKMKYREIADTLHIPIGTVKSRLHNALTRLLEEFSRKKKAFGDANKKAD